MSWPRRQECSPGTWRNNNSPTTRDGFEYSQDATTSLATNAVPTPVPRCSSARQAVASHICTPPLSPPPPSPVHHGWQRRRTALQVPVPLPGHILRKLHHRGPHGRLPLVRHHRGLRPRQEVWLLPRDRWVSPPLPAPQGQHAAPPPSPPFPRMGVPARVLSGWDSMGTHIRTDGGHQ